MCECRLDSTLLSINLFTFVLLIFQISLFWTIKYYFCEESYAIITIYVNTREFIFLDFGRKLCGWFLCILRQILWCSIGIVIMDTFTSREIRVPIEEIDGQEKERKDHTTDAVDFRYWIVSRSSSPPSSGGGRRGSSGRRWRRCLSWRWTASNAWYLPMTRCRRIPFG